MAFALGAVAAGTVGGAVGGAVGSLAPAGAWRTIAALVVLVGAVSLDATSLGRRLPSSRRQVNEDWLARYRGWVYGLAFGAQLGAGLATIVTSAAIYAAAAGAVLCGTVAGGAAVGAAFGLTRALSLLPARTARDGAGLIRLHTALGRLDVAARRLVVAGEIVGAMVLIGGLA
ncbi:MAG TPA: hypothetical protein VG325_06325 [Solirubrobacteraceae bacterium]|nr:hypothetical protein [Solirubrobacteraceae bacterium]